MLTLVGSAAGGVVWGWLLRRAPHRPRGLAAHALVLGPAAAAFPAVAALVGGSAGAGIAGAVAVAAGLVAHLGLRAALSRRARG